ncbi:ribbon-helix-helix domain-containing protein [Nonlabens sp.]
MKVSAGRFGNISKVIRTGLRLLKNKTEQASTY